jgi:adenylate cyclase
MQLFALLKKHLDRFWNSMLRGDRLPTYLGILTTLFVVWVHITDQSIVQGLLTRFENVVYDLRFSVAKSALHKSDISIVIVDYDQHSLEVEGQWPWSRFKIGKMVEKLSADGVAVVGFDVFFPEYDRNVLKELTQRIEQGSENAGDAQALLPQLAKHPELLDADAYFGKSMAGGADVVLGFSFRPNEDVHNGILPDPLFDIEAKDRDVIPLSAMSGYVGNNDTLQNAASGAGFFDTIPDVDGVIRSSPLIVKYKDQIYPSLALDMFRRYSVQDKYKPEFETNGDIRTFTGIRIEKTFIPTDQHGAVRVPYLGRQGSFPYISATDILHDNLTAKQRTQLQSSLVLVGTTSTGLYDLPATPVQAVYPGVEVHANVLNAILNSPPQTTVDANTQKQNSGMTGVLSVLDNIKLSPFPTRPDWEGSAVFVALVIIGLGLSLVYPHLGPALLAVSSSAFIIGLVALNLYMWNHYNLDFSLVVFLLLVLMIATVNMTYGFLKEGQHRKVIKGMFDQYVPPAHIDAMLNDPDKYNFSGDSKDLSVLFSDIRNFTTISEKLKATELKAMLNEFFTPITGIIFENSGTIDKYVGDMVMAFWGAPLDDPRHRNNAVSAALAMLKKVDELKPVFKAQGLPEVNIGVGINSGMMNVGDMGSTYRRAYTVIGDAVNLGSRLEGITKNYGVKLLIGEQTYDGLTDILCRQIDKVQVKGKDEPIRIYQPLCKESEASPELLAAVVAWHAAYQLYLKQKWDAAAAAFEQLHQQDPDTYLYTLYLERIASLRTQELPSDWDGTYRHTSK